MSASITNILRSFGVNRAIGFGVISRMWSMLSGPITVLLIASRFTTTQQGYYYTFGSLLALQIFFELGLLIVLAQFAAHEFAFLSWGKRGEILGPEEHQHRFVDLIAKAFIWYAVSAVLLIVILIPAGVRFFAQSYNTGFSWQLPWALAVIGVGANLLLIPFFAVITGSGEVASNNRREMIGGITGSILSWLVIFAGGGLYALSVVSLGTIIVGLIYLLRSKPRLLSTTFSYAIQRQRYVNTVSWWREVWPMQWKIALSWVSGYFIYQLFTPVLFRYQGPVVAGQMGMTLTAVTVVQSVSIMWLNTRTPEFGKLIATKSWIELEALFKQVLRQVILVSVILSAAGTLLIAALQQFTAIGSRFLPITHVAIFLVAACSNVVTASWATYMRAHKQEPMLTVSMINALLVGASTFFLGIRYSSLGMAVGYCTITLLFLLPMTYMIFCKFKKQAQK